MLQTPIGPTLPVSVFILILCRRSMPSLPLHVEHGVRYDGNIIVDDVFVLGRPTLWLSAF